MIENKYQVKSVLSKPTYNDVFIDEGITYWELWVSYYNENEDLDSIKLIFDTEEEALGVEEGFIFSIEKV